MYAIELEYHVSDEGNCYATLKCVEADDHSNLCILDTCLSKRTANYREWDLVHGETCEILERAQREIERRRKLIAATPEKETVRL